MGQNPLVVSGDGYGAPHCVLVGDPPELPLGHGPGPALDVVARREVDVEHRRLVRPRELEPVREHAHRHPLRSVDRGGVCLPGLPDVPHRPRHRLLSVRPDRNHDRRVVQLLRGDRGDARALDAGSGDRCHLSVGVAEAAETSPGSSAFVGFTCPAPVARYWAGCSPSSEMRLPLRSRVSADVIIADLIAAGDQSGCDAFSSAAIPARWAAAGDVPEIMLNVAIDSSFVGLLLAPTLFGHAATMFTPGPMMSGFSTPLLAALGPRPENAATAGAACGVPDCRGRRRRHLHVGLELDGVCVADVRRREDVGARLRSVHLRRPVHDDHPDAAGPSDDRPLLDARVGAAGLAEDNFPPDVDAVQRAVAARLRARYPPRTGICNRQLGRREIAWLVCRFPVNLLAVAELHGGPDRPVDGARADGEHPRRVVLHRALPRALVARRGAHEDPPRCRRHRADCHGIIVERRGARAEGDREHVDAVGDGLVDACQNIAPEACLVAHLVHRELRPRRKPRRTALRLAEHRSAVDKAPSSCASSVGAVAVKVQRRVAAPSAEPPRSDELVVAEPRIEVAGALPFRRRERHPCIREGRVERRDARVKHADDDPCAEIGLLPEAVVRLKVEEARRVRRVELVLLVAVRADEPLPRRHRLHLSFGEPGCEAAYRMCVRVHKALLTSGSSGRREEGLVVGLTVGGGKEVGGVRVFNVDDVDVAIGAMAGASDDGEELGVGEDEIRV
ncbi:hypothetical protein ACMD2_15512 [Ananas comosus]|uniref:Uncharacterized protein n=1 Tax=Ananas comosus TaxID=4615 RepID=A0A199W9E0_ANACO|nr:hypothetical protein ACMD2_15512 [Ananas comosus]